MNPPQFDHEKLRACQEALRFSAWVDPVIGKRPAKLAARDQPGRASASIVLNIAEGKVSLAAVVPLVSGLTAHFGGNVQEEPAPFGSELVENEHD